MVFGLCDLKVFTFQRVEKKKEEKKGDDASYRKKRTRKEVNGKVEKSGKCSRDIKITQVNLDLSNGRELSQ